MNIRPVLFLIFAVISLALAPAYAATRTAHPMWKCTAMISMVGDQEYYWRHGRDAWSGHGQLTCLDGLTQTSQRIVISFISSEVGFGADLKSKIRVSMMLQTQMHPRDLQIRAVVADRGEHGRTTWRIHSGLSHGYIHAYPVEQTSRRSLQKGSFIMRGIAR